MHHFPNGVQLAALTDGSALKTWVLLVCGNVFVAILAVRAVTHFMKKDWGEMITMFVAAVFVAAYIWFPDGTVAVLKDIWTKISGTS